MATPIQICRRFFLKSWWKECKRFYDGIFAKNTSFAWDQNGPKTILPSIWSIFVQFWRSMLRLKMYREDLENLSKVEGTFPLELWGWKNISQGWPLIQHWIWRCCWTNSVSLVSYPILHILRYLFPNILSRTFFLQSLGSFCIHAFFIRNTNLDLGLDVS